jgi:SSS family solute:Na+ symporter
MAASMLAAFMSTIDTHLNWSASYVINDFYHPFINRNAGQRHYVMVSRLTMLALTMIALLIANRLTTIIGAYKYLAVTFAGIGTVMICRWYWWRVNAYSEIAAIVASLVLANYLQVKLPSTPSTDLFAIRIVITIVAVSGIWVVVTFLTSGNVPDKHTVAFYTKMKIPGPGWKKVRQVAQVKQEGGELGRSALAWVTCVLCIFATTLGIGKLLFQQWATALVYLCVAAAAGCALKAFISKIRFLQTSPH